MSLFARRESTGEASDIAHRSLRLIQTAQHKLAEFELKPVTTADVIHGRWAAKLAEIPRGELEAAATKLERHIAKCGCSVERCFGDDYALSDILLQIRSTQEQLREYLPHWPK